MGDGRRGEEGEEEVKFRILLDMDGPLARWSVGLFRLCGRPDLTERDVHKWDGALDILGLSYDDMWKTVDAAGAAFWADLEPQAWAYSLVEQLEQLGDLYIVSSQSDHPSSVEGKAQWMLKHFPHLYAKRTFFGTDKWLMARPDAILVDDRVKNVRNFNAEGGVGVLFRMPHNSKAVRSVITQTEAVNEVVAVVKGIVLREQALADAAC